VSEKGEAMSDKVGEQPSEWRERAERAEAERDHLQRRYEHTLRRARNEAISRAEKAEAARAQLEEAVKALLREYDAEEDEHGFPFNFALRDAHRALRAALNHVCGPEGGESRE
jgi:hypothetical protein